MATKSLPMFDPNKQTIGGDTYTMVVERLEGVNPGISGGWLDDSGMWHHWVRDDNKELGIVASGTPDDTSNPKDAKPKSSGSGAIYIPGDGGGSAGGGGSGGAGSGTSGGGSGGSGTSGGGRGNTGGGYSSVFTGGGGSGGYSGSSTYSPGAGVSNGASGYAAAASYTMPSLTYNRQAINNWKKPKYSGTGYRSTQYGK